MQRSSIKITYLLAAMIIAVMVGSAFGAKMEDKYNVQYNVSELDSPVQEILWCGTSEVKSEDGDLIKYSEERKQKRLYVLTEKGQLYYSSDYGITLKQINQELLTYGNSAANNVTVFDIMISPVSNRKVFIYAVSGESYYTENCGNTYKSMKHDPNLSFIQPHPTQENMLLGLIPIECKIDDPECNLATADLVVSKDSGVSWQKIVSCVEQAQWDKDKQSLEEYANRIVLVHFEEDDDLKRRKVSYTDNFGKKLMLVEDQAVRFYQNDDYIFILKSTKNFGEYKLVIGYAYLGLKASRQEIDLPLKRVKDESFTVLDVNKGMIIISINHEGDDAGYTNIYISNSEGEKFTLSMQYAVGDDQGNIDFEPVRSNEGTFITNSYQASTVAKYTQVLQKKQQSRSQSQTASSAQTFDLTEHRKTKITFNKGGDWHPLRAPESNLYGNPYKCSGECSLHLKGRTEQQGTPVYSSANAPGLILGTGNVGTYLSKDASEIHTYLSIDGGHNWREIQAGSFEYEIADQGGIIAMARDDIVTSEVLYSIDEGESWRKLTFTNSSFTVNQFVTELSNESRQFLFYGTRQHKGETIGMIGAINFAKLFKKECQGFDTPGEPDSDYDRWYPQNFEGKKCLFGAKVSYIRKKVDSECFNSRDISDLRKEVGSCECTREDYECDYGYTRDLSDPNKCEPIDPENVYSLTKLPPFCKDYYYISKGYTKIPNNSCKGGVEEIYQHTKVPCTEKHDNNTQAVEEPATVNNDKQNDSNYNQHNTVKTPQKPFPTNNQPPQTHSSSSSIWTFVVLFLMLYLLFAFREKIIFNFKKIQKILKKKFKNTRDNDSYGYKRQANNAEQYSLFQNANNEDEEEEPNLDQL